MASKNSGYGGCLLCGVGFLLLAGLFGRDERNQPANGVSGPSRAFIEDKKRDAWIMAENFVRKSISTPSTASFGSVFSDYQDPQDCVTPLGDNRYRVVGWVDAQNGFGATIRNRFSMTLKDLSGPDEKWRVVDGPDFSEW